MGVDPPQDPGAVFAAAMTAAGPFEHAPELAIALSGGADSTCVLLLADAWARARGGKVVALTVDHGLRPGSADEAAQVGRDCAARGIRHIVIPWRGTKPTRAVQERARAARHALLEEWCREAGILHLVLGHHADDQTETIAMRAARRSGPFGLAGMAMISERRHLRLLRPLLGVRAERIRAWLTAHAVGWLEDPSNSDLRFLRARMRAAAVIPSPGQPRWPDRTALERSLAAWLGVHAAIHPEGWVALDEAQLRRLPPGMAALVLRAAFMAVGGASYPPRQAALDAAAAWLETTEEGIRDFRGCRVHRRGGRLVVLRAPARVRVFAAPVGAGETFWDGRFVVRLAAVADGGADILPVGQLAPALARSIEDSVLRYVANALPASRALDGLPGLSHVLCGRRSVALVSVSSVSVIFRPPRPLAGAAFAGSPAQI
jgi:tRNA(Ile)-lysidine synthase